MHLLQAGVNLVYIRDILGHVSVQTTEVYAKADSRKKREAIEKAYVNVTPKENPAWLTNDNLLDWLKDILQRMHLYSITNIAELLPQNWKKPGE